MSARIRKAPARRKIRRRQTGEKMDQIRVIEIRQSVFADNDRDADRLRDTLREKGVYLLNLMSSPGSGKTTMLTKLIPLLRKKWRVGVMEADIDGDVDARTVALTGAKSIQLHTGGMCHLDADMTRQGLNELGTDDLDLVILENVGNLVCPAEFDTGAVNSIMILSVPEGDDKPLKYPLIFTVCDAVLINKTDVLPYFDFDMEKCRAAVEARHPGAPLFPLCARTGEGIEAVADWISDRVARWKKDGTRLH